MVLPSSRRQEQGAIHGCETTAERAGDDLVGATIGASGLVEHAIFGEDLIDGCPSTDGSFSPKTSSRLRMSKVDMLLNGFSDKT